MAAEPPVRPRDLALLSLASGDLLPRQRARDQQADRAGLELKRQLLDRVASIDPEPAELERTLLDIVDQIGPPTGPTRALAITILEEWRMACATPEWVAHLLDQAVRESDKTDNRERKA